jgi:hypothetical protein
MRSGFCFYREARTKLSRRPWRVDTFDALAEKWFSRGDCESTSGTGVPSSPFRRVIMFVDNAGTCMMPLSPLDTSPGATDLVFLQHSEAQPMLKFLAECNLGYTSATYLAVGCAGLAHSKVSSLLAAYGQGRTLCSA